jgi:hypothetical protein
VEFGPRTGYSGAHLKTVQVRERTLQKAVGSRLARQRPFPREDRASRTG